MTVALPSRPAADDGETLVEILIAVAIMAIAMVGLIAGLSTGIIASDSHRRLTDVEVVGRAYGEALVNGYMDKFVSNPASTTLVGDVSTGDNTLHVASFSGFPTSGQFGISVGGEVVKVTAGAGTTTWTLANPGVQATHLIGAKVTRYESCPTAVQLTPTFVVPAEAKKVSTPTIADLPGDTTDPTDLGPPPFPIHFYNNSGSKVTDGTCGGNDSKASDTPTPFWATQSPCKDFQPPVHFVECDPPLIRVTVSVSSTDSATSGRAASAVTRVLIRRGNG